MRQVERPEILKAEVLEAELLRTHMVLDIDGTSPEITNHLSNMTYKVIEGTGELVVGTSSIVTLVPGTQIEIARGTPYGYEGQFTTDVISHPGLLPDFVTFNSERLPRAQRRIVKKVWGETFSQRLQKQVVDDRVTTRLIQDSSHVFALLDGPQNRV
jgi:hypothetical protein